MFDFENIRNEQLIEEREVYENSFFDIRDIQKSEELNYTIEQYEIFSDENSFFFEDDFVCEFDMEFDVEDYFLQLRDEQLIEMQEAYEELELSNIPDEAFQKDSFDIQIESYECPSYDDYEFEYYDDIEIYLDYDEPDYTELSDCGESYMDYMPNDDPFDRIDGCDYPEGPDENLCGFKFPEPFYQMDVFEEPYIEYPDDYFDEPVPEYEIKDEMGIDLYESEELHIKKLIEERLKEEKVFLEFVAKNEIKDEYFMPVGIEDIVLC